MRQLLATALALAAVLATPSLAAAAPVNDAPGAASAVAGLRWTSTTTWSRFAVPPGDWRTARRRPGRRRGLPRQPPASTASGTACGWPRRACSRSPSARTTWPRSSRW